MALTHRAASDIIGGSYGGCGGRLRCTKSTANCCNGQPFVCSGRIYGNVSRPWFDWFDNTPPVPNYQLYINSHSDSVGAYGSGTGVGTRGGGRVYIIAKQVTVNGTIAADGALATANAAAGSGGTIVVNAISMTGSGAFSAQGGSAQSGSFPAGGGGRIALLYEDIVTVTASASGGAATLPCMAGSAGSVFMSQQGMNGVSKLSQLTVQCRMHNLCLEAHRLFSTTTQASRQRLRRL